VDITTQPFTTRRSVYAFIERQNLPGIFRTFDFASPDTSSAQRFSTTVPQQALFLMNSPFVVEQAKKLLERHDAMGATDEARIEQLYRIVLQRAPQADELALAKDFLRQRQTLTTNEETKSAWQYGFGEYDQAAKRTRSFNALPTFTGTAWQGGSKLPDNKLGWVMLTAEGGHVGNDLKHAAVRRWTAPADGAVKIRARLDHADTHGDGVRGRIVSSRSGLVGEWMVHNSKATTNVERVEVKRGDTIDFIADMRGDYGFDSFTWSPRIAFVTPISGGARAEWKAKEDFGKTAPKIQPLTRWQEFAQVLLLSNEFIFVD
jgi:hypothetical protein